jgi:small subunit ribosomal protein S1
MNSNVPGLEGTEEVRSDLPATESPQPSMVDAPEPAQDGADAAAPANGETTSEAATPDTLEADVTSEAEAPAAEGEWLAQDIAHDEAAEATAESSEDAAPEAADGRPFKRGDVLDGTVTSTSPTEVRVKIAEDYEGIIPGRELERMNRETIEMLKEGATVSVFVVNPRTHDNQIILSLNRALEELDWRRAEEYKESQQVYETHVAGYNKGGLIVRFGRVRGFVPQSQLGTDRRRGLEGETPEERWGKMVNEAIDVKVMEVDRTRNRLILSERAAARESRESRKESLISRLQVGEVRTGRVVSLVDFGAFVDIGGAEGLVHLTELSWTHVTHPRELLQVGQEVKVEVISIDPEAKRIGLSMKRQAADPWDTVATDYSIGQLVQGTVTKLTKFGAFVRLVDVPEIEGLVHISELSDQRVNHPREVLEEGETVTLRVVKMDIENRRLGLSLKRVNSAEYLDMDWFAGGE